MGMSIFIFKLFQSVVRADPGRGFLVDETLNVYVLRAMLLCGWFSKQGAI